MMRDLFLSYFMCAAGLFTPLAGLHRFYLDKPVSGILYLLTWGFFGIGTIIDLIRMPALVDEYNVRLLVTTSGSARLLDTNPRFTTPERAILKCAKDNDGIVTVPMVTLASGLTMAEAKTELDRLHRDGFCFKDVDEDGNEIYEFKGLVPKKKLL